MQPQILMQMSHNCRQSPLKALLNNIRKHNKIHGMTKRYGNQTITHNNTKDVPTPQDTPALDNTSLNHSIPEQGSESSAKYSEDPNPWHDLAELQEQFQQLQEWHTQLEPTSNPHIHAEELAQLIDKLQQLAITPQQHPTPPDPWKNLCTWLCRNTQIPYVPHSDKPHHIFTSKHLHIWWTRLHQAGRLAHQSSVSCWYSKGKSSMPSQD